MRDSGGQVVSIGAVCKDFSSGRPATLLACVFLTEGDSIATFLPGESD
jgi:hypothetical protein